MATLRLDQNYISNVLIPHYAAVAFQTECGGNADFITSFHLAINNRGQTTFFC